MEKNMSQLYKLTVKIPHDDIGFPKTQEILTRMSYTKRYWKAIAYPNSVDYILAGRHRQRQDCLPRRLQGRNS